MSLLRSQRSPLCYGVYKSHLEFIKDYRKVVDDYFDQCEKYGYDPMGSGSPLVEALPKNNQDRKKYEETKRCINLNLKLLLSYLDESRENPVIFYTPPPITGGIQGNINIFANIFLHARYQLDRSAFTDVIERAEGYYVLWLKYWKWRRWNPFLYLYRGIKYFFTLPIEAYEYLQKRGQTNSLVAKIIAIGISIAFTLLINGTVIVAGIVAFRTLLHAPK